MHDPGPRLTEAAEEEKGSEPVYDAPPPRRLADADEEEEKGSEPVIDAPPARRSRPDVAARRARNKNLEFFTVKKTLRQFCRAEARALACDKCLLEVNLAVAEGYLLAEFYVLRQLQAGRPLCKMNQTFYGTCLSLVTNADRTRESIREQFLRRNDLHGDVAANDFPEAEFRRWIAETSFYNGAPGSLNVELEDAGYEFRQLRGGLPTGDMTNLSAWLSVAAQQMATNLENSIVANFARRLRSYLRDYLHLEKAHAKTVLDAVFAIRYGGDDPVVKELRVMIHRKTTGRISWEAHHLVPVLFELLRLMEARNKENENDPDYEVLKLYSPMPSKMGYEASYCTIQSSGLRGLLLRSPDVDRSMVVTLDGVEWSLAESLKDKNTWSRSSELWWRRLFRVEQVERDGHGEFAGEISTDGYGVSVHLRRPTRGNRREKRSRRDPDEAASGNTSDVFGLKLAKTPKGKLADYNVVWGIDPGRTDFITATNNEGKTVRFRTSAYRSASGFNRSNRRSRFEINKTPPIRQLLRDTPTKKTASLDDFVEHILFFFTHGRALTLYFYRPIFRRQRFRRFALKTHQIDRAIRQLVGPRGTKTIVGFGDSGAAHNSHIKKCPAGPVKRLACRLSYRCEVVVVDEYRTSRVHQDCTARHDLTNQTVKRVFRRDGKEHVVKVYKVLHCLKRNQGCGRTVDRDVNASKNILEILTRQLNGDATRPERLRRLQPQPNPQ